MKKLFYCSIILSAFVFTNCKKAEDNPKHNQLVMVDRNGNTVVSRPMETEISGSFDPSFGVSASTSNNDCRFSIGPFKGSAPPRVTFISPAYSNPIGMWISHTATGYWVAIGGTVELESKSGSAAFGNGGTKFMKITLNNIPFIRQSTFANPTPPADTIWVSGIINAKR